MRGVFVIDVRPYDYVRYTMPVLYHYLLSMPILRAVVAVSIGADVPPPIVERGSNIKAFTFVTVDTADDWHCSCYLGHATATSLQY